MKMREIYADKELEGCTFKPHRMTKDDKKTNNTTDNSSISSKRINELYQLGLKIVSKKREGDKDPNEIEGIKNKEYCTFKPTLDMYI